MTNRTQSYLFEARFNDQRITFIYVTTPISVEVPSGVVRGAVCKYSVNEKIM